jgi:hypothetical protein
MKVKKRKAFAGMAVFKNGYCGKVNASRNNRTF